MPAKGWFKYGTKAHDLPEYFAWARLKARCENPAEPCWPRYGGRGITIAPEWRESFEQFYADVGPRPSPQHSLDRIDNEGHYVPGNVRWATAREQANNRRSNHRYTYNGETLTLVEWAHRLGVPRTRLWARLQYGWSVAEALSRPKLSGGWASGRRITLSQERG